MNCFKRDKENGVTLIALVVTVMVLIIITGVSLTSLKGEHNILKKAEKATDESKAHSLEVAVTNWKMTNKESGDTSPAGHDARLNKLLNKLEKDGVIEPEDKTYILNNEEITIGDKTISFKENPQLKVGDFVNYVPNRENDSVYSSSLLSTSITGSGSNGNISANYNTKWRVFRIYKDGTVDLIGDPFGNLYLKGYDGYNNGVNLLNDICKVLYSDEGNGVVARSINVDDIEYYLTSVGKNIRNNTVIGDLKFGDSKEYYSPNNSCPSLFIKENASKIGTLSRSEAGQATGMDSSQSPLYVENNLYNFTIDSTNLSSVSDLIKDNSRIGYWVATRTSIPKSDAPSFGILEVNSSNILESDELFYKSVIRKNNPIRPIVTITAADQKIGTTGSGDSSSPYSLDY